MNFPFFVSKRISKETVGSFSSIINRIAIVSIGLGLAVLLLAFMVLYGFKTEIKDKIYSFSGHLIVSKYTLSTSYEEGVITVDDSLIQFLRDYPLTKHVQPYAMKAGLIKSLEKKEGGSGASENQGEVQGVIIKGVDESFDTLSFHKHMIAGRFPDFSGNKYSTEVAVSAKIANYLQLKVEDNVLVYFVQDPPRFRKLKIAGVYETGLEEFDEKIIIGDLDMVRRINNWPDSLAGGIEIFIKDTDKLEQAADDLFYSLRSDLYVDKVTDRFIQIFDWMNLLNRNVVILLVIILFVSGTSIISIILILIMERTQMIGVMKALGASNKMIRSIFFWNGLQLIVKGLLWGNVIGLLLGFLQYQYKLIPLDAANYYMSHVPIEFDLLTIIGLNILVLILIGLTLLIPVAIISRVQPVKAIRFD
ncbi:MAG: ABC transporter permease [Ekhidna sp.]